MGFPQAGEWMTSGGKAQAGCMQVWKSIGPPRGPHPKKFSVGVTENIGCLLIDHEGRQDAIHLCK